MTIYKNSAFDKRVHNNNSPNAEQANLIPNIWYFKILRKNGRPDGVAIAILSELYKLYKNSGSRDHEFQLSYLELSSRFNYSLRQLYKAVVSLEAKDLLKRRYDTIQVKGKPLGNFLFLTLNIEALSELQNAGSCVTESSSKKMSPLLATQGSGITVKNLSTGRQ